MKENFGLKGHVYTKVIKPDGEIIENNFQNIVVADGKTNVAGMLILDTGGGDAYDFIGIGSGESVAAVTDTGLLHEVYSRIASSGAQIGSLASFIGSFAISGTIGITEYGLFNAATAGSMLSRASGTAVALTSGDFLEVNWQVTVG